MSDRDESIHALNAWFAEHNENYRISNKEDWEISEYRDAFLFSPSDGRRSNLLFLVRGTDVSVFSPASSSIEEVYSNIKAGRGG